MRPMNGLKEVGTLLKPTSTFQGKLLFFLVSSKMITIIIEMERIKATWSRQIRA